MLENERRGGLHRVMSGFGIVVDDRPVAVLAKSVVMCLFGSFHLGAFQAAINEGNSLQSLGGAEAIERDVLVYRSYIALGSYQVRILRYSVLCPIIPRRLHYPARTIRLGCLTFALH